MEPMLGIGLLIIITVCASYSLDPTEPSIDGQSRNLSAGTNISNHEPIKSPDENRLEITLKIDENDKEIIDSDMGKKKLCTVVCACVSAGNVVLGKFPFDS